jgi:hypothetical protein
VVVLWLTRSAWSQWLASGPVDSVVLVTGDLSISPGAVSWTVADQGLSGDSWQSLAPVTLGVGQQVVISQVLGTDFEGENLNVALTVNLTDQSPAVSGTWRALTSQGALFPGETAPVVIGQAVNLYNVDGADLSGMVIELTLTQQADPTWVDPQTVVSATPDTLALMVIDAQQVRCGDGFTTACPQGVGS